MNIYIVIIIFKLFDRSIATISFKVGYDNSGLGMHLELQSMSIKGFKDQGLKERFGIWMIGDIGIQFIDPVQLEISPFWLE